MKIKTVGIVGAGTMGSALAQKFAQEDFKVILADRELSYTEKGIQGIKTMLNEGVNKKVFTQNQVNNFLTNITETENLNDLKTCEIVIEAVFENFETKANLFQQLSEIVPKETILATNTSSFSVNELSKNVKYPERFIGLHFFYHAAKNRLVEIIPSKLTSKSTINNTYRFSVISGKDPIYTKDDYGFAVNRFFVPWLNESVKLFEEKIATIEEIDNICMKTLGIGMGPFALMNATGVPIALHAQKTLEHFGSSYKVAKLLEDKVNNKTNWDIKEYSTLNIDADKEKKVNNRLLGSIFFVCSQILNEKICTAIDLNKGAKIGLKWKKGPIELMQKLGENQVKKLISNYCEHYNEKSPNVSSEYWNMNLVTFETSGNRGIITMNRPEDLNALNEVVIKQLEQAFDTAEKNPSITEIIITGNGKAFVAGADIKFFIDNMKNKSVEKIIRFTSYGQSVFNKIDNSKKTVIAILNGLTLGGGLELALCADIILSVNKSLFAFPETGIGIYPGLGGTQRTTQRTGKGLAKYLILTGKTISASEAKEIGLIDDIVTQEKAFDIIDGKIDIPQKKVIQLEKKWKQISELFDNYNVNEILNEETSLIEHISPEDAQRLIKTIKNKAPIALQIAEKLIEERKGPSSELDSLELIFNTNDAMLGLSNIGKKVEFKGN